MFTLFPFVITCRGLLACYNHAGLWKAAPRSYITPATFITLLERHSLVAMACVTLLQAPVLPASLVLLHLSTPGSTALLSTLLRHGCPQGMRFRLQQSLLGVSQLLAQLLSDPVQLRDWVCKCRDITADTPEAKGEMAAFTIRSLVLLFTLAINQRYASTINGVLASALQRMVCADASATQQKAMSAVMQLLPRALTDMINRMGARRAIGNTGEPIIDAS